MLSFGVAALLLLLFVFFLFLFLRLLFGNRLNIAGGNRGRQQRLGVVDSFDVDRQRQLVLVRRDNTEHLILIGGPNDVLIESAISRVEARERPAYREPAAIETQRPSAPEYRPSFEPAAQDTPELARPELSRPELATPEPVRIERFVPESAKAEAVKIESRIETAWAEQPRIEPARIEPAETEPPAAQPAAEQSRFPDLFARMRSPGRNSASPEQAMPPVSEPEPVVPEPAAAPADEPPGGEPRLDDMNFFETEIAKALAPSLRGRPDSSAVPAAPSAVPPASPPPAVSPPAPPALAPRAPFQFSRPLQRSAPQAAPEPSAAPAPEQKAESEPLRATNVPVAPRPPFEGFGRASPLPAPPRAPVPPFFSRSAPKLPEPPRAEPEISSADERQDLPDVPEPVRSEPSAAGSPSAPPENAPASSPSGMTDDLDRLESIEEEMAKLLGRPVSKE